MTRFRKTSLIFFASFLLAFFTGCSDSKGTDDPLPAQSYLTIENRPSTFGSEGGSVPLTFGTNRAWHIDALLQDEDTEVWFQIAPLSGEAGERIEVTVRVDPNAEYTVRDLVLRLRTVPEGTETVLEERIAISQSKKNAILLGENRLEIGNEEQTLTVAVQSNVEYTVTLKQGGDWIEELPESRAAPGLDERTHRFTVLANPDAQERTGIIVFTDKDSDLSDELTVVQAAWVDSDPERTALEALYDAAGGGGWTRSDNWCSDKPLAEWYGVETDAEGRVTALRLPENNLSGAILKYVGKLTSLRHLDLSRNALEEDLDFFNAETKQWCSHLDDLLELETIDMNHNRLTAGLPMGWSRMVNLRYVDLSSNRLSGGTPIPIQWEPLYRNGKYPDVILNDNYIGGSINDFLIRHPQWGRIALQFIRQKMMAEGNEGRGGLDYEGVILPDFTFTDLRDGTQHSIREVYSANKLTMLLQWDPTDEASLRFGETFVKRFHTLYNAQGLDVVAITPEGDEYRLAAERYLQTHDVAWPVVTEYADAEGKRMILPTEPYPSFFMVDQYGEVIEDMYTGKWISDPFWVSGNPPTTADIVNRPFEIVDLLNKRMNKTFELSTYQSTDFSMDKKYETLQRATRGKGIDIVLIGEAFTDVDIETGFYRQVMEFAMESFFALEPLKSYREYFNVHMVYAVSRDAYIGYWNDGVKTALGVVREKQGTWFDAELSILRTLPNYYRLPVPSQTLVPVVGVVVNNDEGGVAYLNSIGIKPCFAFTGYLYGERGLTRGTFIHETAGHAFGLLGDEYEIWYDPSYFGSISDSDRRSVQKAQNKGWHLNLSLSNDTKQVSWSHLIGHQRFPYVGVYEGGGYYRHDVWRSEDESVMRSSESVHYFNAIGRELIVKRIMELAGEEYTFEKFLAKDSDIGRPTKSAASALRRRPHRPDDHHQPPILGE